MNAVEKVRAICKERGIPYSKLEKDLGFANGYLGRLKKGTFPSDRLYKIAKYLNISAEELMELNNPTRIIRMYHENDSLLNSINNSTEDRHQRPTMIDLMPGVRDLRVAIRIPVLGRVAAGIPLEAAEEIIDWEEINQAMAGSGEYFGLLIKGDSMQPRFNEGDVVIVRKQDTADDGDIVIALVNGNDAVCKRLKIYQDGSVALLSTNPAYDPLYFSKSEVDETPVRIIGKVKELRAKF